MQENLINVLSQEKILPIIRGNDPDVVIGTANALIEGGINVLEINVQNSGIYRAIEEVSKHAFVCAGGIITAMQAKAAISAGAKSISSPIFQMNLVKISKNEKIPYIAGTSTANEAYSAWKARIPVIKIYPITAMGGVQYIEDLLRPMPFLNVLPLGNVKLNEVNDYIKAGACAVGVGRDFYDGFNYNEITKRAKRVLTDIRG